MIFDGGKDRKGVSMKKMFFVVLVAALVRAPAFAQTVNDFKIDLSRNMDAVIITGYTGTASRVVIPAEIEGIPVRTIGKSAFRGNKNITEVLIPDMVTTIEDGGNGNGAFSDCTGLVKVTLPRGLTKIGDFAFARCKFTTISIPDSVTTIGEGAFLGCSNLASLTIPDGITSIGMSAFAYTRLASIVIPNGVRTIGQWTFSNCSNLTSITIPNSVTEIGIQAFKNCTGLTSITIPISVKTIRNKAFGDCKNLTTVILEEGAAIRFASDNYGDTDSFGGCGKLDTRSQIALKKAGYRGSF
jgi:hypothetical protein